MTSAALPQSRFSEVQKNVLSVFVAFFCMLAFSFQGTVEGALRFEINTIFVYAIGIIAFFLARDFFSTRQSFRWSVFFVSLFFGLTYFLGTLFIGAGTILVSGLEMGDVHSSGSRVLQIIALATMLLGSTFFFYIATTWAYQKITHAKSEVRSEKGRFFGFSIDYRLCLIVLFVAWLPYLIVFFPGTVTSDVSRQLAQYFGIAGLSLDTHFPYFAGLLYGSLYSLGTAIDPSGYAGIFLMMLLQLVSGLFVFSNIVVWLDRLDIPGWIAKAALVFFALFPLVPIYIVSISKDTFFALFAAFFALQTLVLFLGKREGDTAKSWLTSPVAFAVCALLISLMRNGGILLALVGLIAVALIRPKRSLAASALGVLVVYSLWQFALMPSLGVEAEGPKESLSIPSQIVAACIHEDAEISDHAREVLEASFSASLPRVGASYDPNISDNVKALLEPEDLSQTLQFLGAVGEIAVDNPAIALNAALRTTYGVWYPFTSGGFLISEYAPYECQPGDTWAYPEWFASYADLPGNEERIFPVVLVLQFIRVLPGISLLNAPGFYAWLIVFLLGFVFYQKRGRRCALAVLIPFVMLEAIMIAGPVTAIRYALPLVFSLPILISLLFARTQHQR